MKLMKAIDILIEKIERDYKEDIACVVIMGSNIYNDTHSRSDLDMYFITNTERGNNLGQTFIIDGIGFDFWPITWKRMEGIANHNERITSILTEGQVVYHSSETDLEKFNALKRKALDVSDKKKFISKSKKQLVEMYEAGFKLTQTNSIKEVRQEAVNIIYASTYAIALLNQETVKRGRGKLKSEIMTMKLIPKDFERLYDTVFVSKDLSQIKKNYQVLIQNTEALIYKVEKETLELAPVVDPLTHLYEEMINCYNKIYRACDINDTVTPLFAAVELMNELEAAFEGTKGSSDGLNDLISFYDPEDLHAFRLEAEKHQLALEALLESYGVPIQRFSDFDELDNYFTAL